MKKKKSLLSLGLLALVLVLGVGYAVVSSVDLEFGGSASVKDAEIDVDIENVADDSTGEATVEHTWTKCATEDTFTIKDMVLNEEVTITYTIKNHETDVAATLAEKVALTNSNEEYFDAEYAITNPSLAAGGETTIVVTVTLTKTPVDSKYNSTDIAFTVSATADDNHQVTQG